jgi:hypothetical protein
MGQIAADPFGLLRPFQRGSQCDQFPNQRPVAGDLLPACVSRTYLMTFRTPTCPVEPDALCGQMMRLEVAKVAPERLARHFQRIVGADNRLPISEVPIQNCRYRRVSIGVLITHFPQSRNAW